MSGSLLLWARTIECGGLPNAVDETTSIKINENTREVAYRTYRINHVKIESTLYLKYAKNTKKSLYVNFIIIYHVFQVKYNLT